MTAPTSFAGLAFSVEPVLTSAGAINTSGLPASTVIAGFMDPVAGVRFFNPYAEGLTPVSGDAVNTWLPSTTVAVSAATATDNAAPWYSQDTGLVGQVTLTLKPGSKNTVEASSVMTYKLSPQAFVITCTTSDF